MKTLKLITALAALAALSACGNLPSTSQSALSQALVNYNTSAVAGAAAASYEPSALMNMNNMR